MTFEEVKQAYLKESEDFGLATEDQVYMLSYWLDANDYHNSAFTRWLEDQDEIRYMTELKQD